jgi:hypothetical protein
MADPFSKRDVAGLSRRAYTLRPAVSLARRVAAWASVCVLSAVTGAACLHFWHAHGHAASASCGEQSLDETSRQTELARAQLALAQESAARAAVQKTADSATADVARLNTELQFLRGQSKGGAGRR